MSPEQLPGSFSTVDWAVVLGFLALITWLGERLSGRQATIRDFFLGGRKLPWYAVSASIIATEISAVTLVSLPSVVFREGGNLTYLQLGLIGSFLARWTVALVLVPAYYQREIFSPYDYMGARLGRGVRGTTTALFALGGVLSQSARVFLVAVVLEVLLREELLWVESHLGLPPLVASVAVISLIAIVWTWMGGIATVIWTDAMLFLVFLSAVAISLLLVVAELDGSFGALWAAGRESDKLQLIDLSANPAKAYTLWSALFLVSWGNIAAYGTDQMMAQRVLCCRSVREARWAVVTSYGAMVVTVLVGLVGIGLYAYYREHPLQGAALELYREQEDRIYPIFVLQAMPTGLKGLIIAGIFAAAISSLDSILAALSQTTLSAAWLPWRARALARLGRSPEEPEEQRRTVRVSRWLVLIFGVLLGLLAVLGEAATARYGSILDLALASAGYTQGALLAGFLLAFLPLPRTRAWGRGFLWSAPLSVMMVLAVAWRVPWALEVNRFLLGALAILWIGAGIRAWLATRRGAVEMTVQTVFLLLGIALVVAVQRWEQPLAWTWYVPIGCTTAFLFALLLAPPSPPTRSASEVQP